jgi:RNA polymerase sigma-70 factor (ECF subfamily)
MEALRAKEPQAVERWFHEYADAVYTFALYRVGRDPDLAEEVVQDTFVAALSQIQEYDPRRGMMLPWLTYRCRNSIRNALRQRKGGDALADFWEETDRRLLAAYRQLATAPLPEDILHQQETKELVQLTLASIPGNYQQVLTQHYLEQRPLKEIAASHGLSEGAIKSLLHRARLAFKTAFVAFSDAMAAEPSLEGGAK